LATDEEFEEEVPFDEEEEEEDDEELDLDDLDGLDEAIEANLDEDEDEEEEDVDETENLGEDVEVALAEEDEEEPEDEEESLDVLLTRDKRLDEEELGRLENRTGLATADMPIGAEEFTCQSCFLVKRRAQLADEKKLICFDCA
jgi:hypothetical protein